jgi:hypothetical protein
MEISNDRSFRTLEHPDEQPITARLAAAGSLRRELEDLLQIAPYEADLETYRKLVVDENVTGKRTEASRKKAWTNLKGRYLLDPGYLEFVRFRELMERTGNARDRGLLSYLMMSRVDRLFREVTVDEIVPNLDTPDFQVFPERIDAAIQRLVAAEAEPWRPVTRERVWQHVLTSLKDFGVIIGSRTRRTLPIQPGMNVVLFAAALGKLEGLTDRQVLDARWFRLLGLNQEAVIDKLYAAAQQGAITFRKQAEVVELELPEPGER